MSDIKLDPAEQALFNEVGSRGDYFREAMRDRAAQQVNETGRMSEITTEGGSMLDAVRGPETTSRGKDVSDVVPPSDFTSVAGKAPGSDPDPNKAWPNQDGSGT